MATLSSMMGREVRVLDASQCEPNKPLPAAMARGLVTDIGGGRVVIKLPRTQLSRTFALSGVVLDVVAHSVHATNIKYRR